MRIITQVNLPHVSPPYVCPHCGNRVRGTIAFGQGLDEVIDNVPAGKVHLLAICPTPDCGPAYLRYNVGEDLTEHIYPFPAGSNGAKFDAAVPKYIASDYFDAVQCFHAGAYKAAVVMARRALQNMAVDKKIPGNLRLERQINAMFSAGLITRNLLDAAHEVRHFGNFGAHPRRDQLNETTPDEAEAVLSITMDFITDLYIRPHRTDVLRQRRSTPPRAAP